MELLIGAIAFTLGVSAFCSVAEAMILSTTIPEIEDLKKRRPRKGQLLEKLRTELEETISAILTLNTIANTLGAVVVGGLATRQFGDVWLGVISGLMTLAILIFSEILPKNFGVAYRTRLQPCMVLPLIWIRKTLKPLTVLSEAPVRWLIRRPHKPSSSGREILLLAEKGAREGSLQEHELRLIANALSVGGVQVQEIMTPRTVVVAKEETSTVGEVLHKDRTIRFGRMPIYRENFDEITGIVRRRDILSEVASGRRETPLNEIRQEALFVPEMTRAADALNLLIGAHQQLAVVLDEFGGVSGVISIEDIIEHIIGSEIYEKDDLAIDMRHLALTRNDRQTPEET